MSLIDFQRALCDAIASPPLARQLRTDPEPALARYDLTPRERRRLVAVAHQRGMETSCTIYRLNRVTPICLYLPMTTRLLGNDLILEAEAFWRTSGTDLQFQKEVTAFGAFLLARLETGQLSGPFLAEVLAFELAANELQFRFRHHGAETDSPATGSDCSPVVNRYVRGVPFSHEPLALLDALAAGELPETLEEVESYLLVDGRGERLQLWPLAPELGRRLDEIAHGDVADLSRAEDQALLDAGILVAGPHGALVPA